jgi:hypothetical protein
MERLTAAKAKGWDALANGDIFLFEEFRLDRQAEGFLGAINAAFLFPYQLVREPLMFSPCSSNGRAISSPKKRSWPPSGGGRLSKAAT